MFFQAMTMERFKCTIRIKICAQAVKPLFAAYFSLPMKRRTIQPRPLPYLKIVDGVY